MSEQCAILQQCNQDLVKIIENLRNQQECIDRQIEKDEEKKRDLLNKIGELSDNLEELVRGLDDNYKKRDTCTKAITEAENGLKKIIESSQVLLCFMQKETDLIRKDLC